MSARKSKQLQTHVQTTPTDTTVASSIAKAAIAASSQQRQLNYEDAINSVIGNTAISIRVTDFDASISHGNSEECGSAVKFEHGEISLAALPYDSDSDSLPSIADMKEIICTTSSPAQAKQTVLGKLGENKTANESIEKLQPCKVKKHDDEDEEWDSACIVSATSSRKSVRPKKANIRYIASDADSEKENGNETDLKPMKAAKVEEDDDEDWLQPPAVEIKAENKKFLMEVMQRSQKKLAATAVKGPPGKRRKFGLLSEQDGIEQLNLLEWKNKATNRPPARFVEVLNGMYPQNLVTFTDSEIFQLRRKTAGQSFQPWQEVDVALSVDVSGLEYKLVTRQLVQQDLDTLFMLVERDNNLSRDMKRFDPPCAPRAGTVPAEMPLSFRVQLKTYQLMTVAWMQELEEKVAEGITISRLFKWKSSTSEMLFDLKRKLVYIPPIKDSKSNSLRVKTKGGILADEMGLGKTVTLLALLVSHRRNGIRIPRPNDLEWHDDLLPTGSTLLIAPSHLTSQWKNEAEKCMPGLRVIIITTKPQFDKTTYADILRADLVVVSVQFLLTNKCYTDLPHGDSAVARLHLLLRQPGINPLMQSNPNFCHFYWWRVVCDEGHELMTYEDGKRQGPIGGQESKGLQAVNQIQSMYRWYMTGTPFPNGERSLRAALKFLGAETDDRSLMNPDGSLLVDTYGVEDINISVQLLHNIILNHFYVRNTKQSIGQEYDVPEYIEELMLLTMSDVERAIYDRSASEKEKRQLCCHLQIAERMQIIAGSQQKTLEEVKAAMIEHTRKEITSCLSSLKITEQSMRVTGEQLANETAPSVKKVLEERIKCSAESIATFQKQLQEHQATIQYFESLIPRIEQRAEEPCVICLDPIRSLTLTPCGHLFCNVCILTFIRQQNNCPTCRKQVVEGQLFEVKDAKSQAEMQKMSELLRLTEQYGTKMAYLIFYLRYLFREQPNSRVIIFSQWENLLTKIGETLDLNGLRNVFVKGNVHVRNKAINCFKKQDKTRVIMLSLEHAASGTNLIEATHVVLIDPVAGTKQRSVAVESQAIGRAHRMGQNKRIKVVRLVMKNTLEHEIYSRNYANDNVEHLEMNFDTTHNYGVQVISTVKKVQLATIPPPAAADLQEAGTSAVAANNYYAQQHEDDSDEDQCDFDRDNLDDLAWGHQCDCRQCSAKRRKQPKSKKSRRGGGWRGGWKRRNDCSLM